MPAQRPIALRRLAAGLAATGGILLGAGKALAFSAVYDQTVRQGGQTIVSTVTIHDDRFRIESVMDGRTVIIIRNRDGVYHYLPGERTAMRLPALDPGQQPLVQAEGYLGYLKGQQAERIGAETVNGYPCDVYRFGGSGGATTAWVWRERQFPVKLEMDGPSGRVITELTNVRLGVIPPTSAFELPPGVQVMDMGSMMDLRGLTGGR